MTFEFSLDPKVATGTYAISDIRLYDVAGNQSFYSTSNLESLGFLNSWTIDNVIADNVVPNITGCVLTPSINSSDLNRKQIKVDVSVDDQDTDIRTIYMRLLSPDNAIIGKYVVSLGRLFSTTVTDKTYSHTISLPLEYPDGTYNMSYILVSDKALNSRTYSVSDLIALGFDTNVVFGSGNDHAPVISSSSSFSVAENQTSIGTVTATDDDSGDSVTFTVSGSELSITSAGVLTFATAPDYETKTSYTATVTASDGTNTTNQSITVNVTDVNESSVTAIADTASTDEDNSVTFDPLANDLSLIHI